MLNHLSEAKIREAVERGIERMISDEVTTILAPAAEALQDRVEARISRLNHRIGQRLDDLDNDE